MWSAWGQAKAKGRMTGVSNTFLLISIFIRPSLCEDPEKKGKQDLIVSVISVLLLILVLLTVGCCFIHYKMMMTTNVTMRKETKSFSVQTHHMERMVLLTPSQAMPLTASQQQPPQLTAAPTPSPQRSTPSPEHILTRSSISHIYKSESSESFHSEELGSIYSVDHFCQLEESSRSTSQESLDSKGSKIEEQWESSESETIILCSIQGM